MKIEVGKYYKTMENRTIYISAKGVNPFSIDDKNATIYIAFSKYRDFCIEYFENGSTIDENEAERIDREIPPPVEGWINVYKNGTVDKWIYDSQEQAKEGCDNLGELLSQIYISTDREGLKNV